MTFKTWGQTCKDFWAEKIWVVVLLIFFIFTPKLGEDEPRLTCAYFSKELKPPTGNRTSKHFLSFAMNVPFWVALVGGFNITLFLGLKQTMFLAPVIAMFHCKTLFFQHPLE